MKRFYTPTEVFVVYTANGDMFDTYKTYQEAFDDMVGPVFSPHGWIVRYEVAKWYGWDNKVTYDRSKIRMPK